MSPKNALTQALFYALLTLSMHIKAMDAPRQDTPRPSRKSASEILSETQKEAAENIAASRMLIEGCLAQELREKKDALSIAEKALAQTVKEKRRQSKLVEAGVKDATLQTKQEEMQDIEDTL